MASRTLERMDVANQLAEELRILADDLVIASQGDAGARNRVESYIDGHWFKLCIGPAWKVAFILSDED